MNFLLRDIIRVMKTNTFSKFSGTLVHHHSNSDPIMINKILKFFINTRQLLGDQRFNFPEFEGIDPDGLDQEVWEIFWDGGSAIYYEERG